MSRLNIGSVHFESDFWLKHQLSFISRTTKDYDLSVYLNNIADRRAFAEVNVIGYDDTVAEMHESHARGLRAVIKHFKDTDSEFFLILDSDCFPVKVGWFDYLLEKMSGRGAAMTIRFESLSSIVHPSALFFNRAFLESDILNFEVVTLPDLLGNKLPSPMQLSRTTDFYPLIRTNRLNLHPVYFGIFGNCFYHHGCGSRPALGPWTYYDMDFNTSVYLLESAMSRFESDPLGFVTRLITPTQIKV